MTDPDAWMNDISTIVSRKNQAKQNAAKDKRDREQHAIEAYQQVRELVQGQPTEAFEQFGSFLNAEGETARIKHDPTKLISCRKYAPEPHSKLQPAADAAGYRRLRYLAFDTSPSVAVGSREDSLPSSAAGCKWRGR